MRISKYIGHFFIAILSFKSGAQQAPLVGPFDHQKMILNSPRLQTQILNQKLQDQVLASGTALSVLFDSYCLSSHGENYPISSMAKVQVSPLALTQLPRIAVSITLNAVTPIQGLAAWVDQDPCVLGLTEESWLKTNGQFTNDPGFTQQLGMSFIGADQGYDIALGSSIGLDLETTIAIVDSGVDYTHPDLAPQMWRGLQGEFGYDFVNNDSDPMDDNSVGHGTHVAGIAAARGNNAIGISGVLNQRARIMAIKVMDQNGDGNATRIVNGIRFAIQNKAHVINISIGGPGSSAAIDQAIIDAVNAGIVVVIAAGNDSTVISRINLFVPASLGASVPGAITVGSVDATSGGISSFSNVSSEFVEIAAPGAQKSGTQGVLSTLPSGAYGYLSGTSMATPFVAGSAALVIGLFRTHGLSYTPADVESLLKLGSVVNPSLSSVVQNGGVLNLKKMIRTYFDSYYFSAGGGAGDK